MKLYRLIIALLIALVAILPVAAQTDEELTDDEIALMEEVAAIYDNLYTVTSIQSVSTQDIEQTIEFLGDVLQQFIGIEIEAWTLLEDGAVTAGELVMNQTITSQMGVSDVSGDVTFEFVQIGNDLYVQAVDPSAIFIGEYPTGWVNLTENPAGFPGFENMDFSELSGFDTLAQYPINIETVESIRLIDVPEEEELENVVRGYEVILRTEALAELGVFDEIAEALADPSLGVDMAEIMNVMLQGAYLEIVIYVDEDDMPAYIETILVISTDIGSLFGMGSMQFDQVATSTTIFVSFDEPYEITAPDID